MISLRDSSKPEWCGGSEERSSSAEACESAYVYYELDGVIVYAPCVHDAEAGVCKADDAAALACTDPEFCEAREAMVSLRDLDEPEWCNTSEERSSSAGACESAYVYYEVDGGITLYAPCVHDAEAGVCGVGYAYSTEC